MYNHGAAARRGERVHLIDALRGASILLMVLYHFGFNLTQAGLLPRALFFHPILNALQQAFAGVFIVICGFSCAFSRNNAKRGGILLLCGIGISAVTFFIPSSQILFGILHFLGVSILLYSLIRPVVSRIPLILQPIVYTALFLFSFRVIDFLNSPFHIRQNGRFLWPLGVVYPGFFSADYFPLFPWFFVFLLGTWLGQIAKAGRLPGIFYRVRCKRLEAIGRHTLAIYLLHQPVIFGVFALIELLK